jgi:CO/xanthine dehydrogenase FAD-binding subunit
MRAAISSLELVSPRSLREALDLLRADPTLMPLAGCTDVYVALNAGMTPARRYLNLWPLAELRGIGVTRGVLSIGALTTYSELIASRLVRARLPMLVAAAREVGGRQIHNRGTLGGNIANASPAGDTLPVLLATDATVVLRSADGHRRVALTEYYTAYRESVRRPEELIVAVEVGELEGRQWFRKVGTRAAQTISKVVLAGVRAERPRLAIGSVAPTPRRLVRTEQALSGGASLEEAQRVLQSEIQPIDDLRSTASYRRRVAASLLADFWSATSARAAGRGQS